MQQPAMYLVQQGNAVVADASKSGLLVHQQQPTQQQAWVQPANAVMYQSAAFPHPQSQQSRLSHLPVGTSQMPNQQALVTGLQTAGPDNDKQVVYVNVNGTLQQGVVSNDAVYLLSNPTPTVTAGRHAASMPQTRTVPHPVGVQTAHSSMQLQKPMMQHVLHNGHLLPVPGSVAVPRMGVQPSAVQKLQPKIQNQMPARPTLQGSVGPTLHNQQPVVVTMSPATSSNMAAFPPVGRVMPQMVLGTNNLHVQPQQQPALLQMPRAHVLDSRSAASVAAPGVFNPQLVNGRLASDPTSASATTSSMLSRTTGGNMTGNQHGSQMVPAGSQAMTFAATLAALPSHTAGVGVHNYELSSPAVPPTTPGIGIKFPTSTGQTATPAAVPVKMATGTGAASTTMNNTAHIVNSSTQLLDYPVATGSISLTTTGSSPLVSQPGTPSRSNSVGTHSSSSSSSSSAGAVQLPTAVDPVSITMNSDKDGKLTVMRMFARTFIETGIGLEQALGMIQPADRDMLEAAFAGEAASARGEAPTHGSVHPAPSAGGGSTVPSNSAGYDSELARMPTACGPTLHGLGLQPLVALGESADQTAAGSSQGSFGLDGWGFSLFSITNAGSTSSTGSGSSFGDKTNQTVVNSSGPDTDFSTETAIMLANLQL